MRSRITSVAAVLAASLLSTACSSSTPAPTVTVTAPASPAPTITVTATPTAAVNAAPPTDGGAQLSEEDRHDLYLLTLTAIDPGLTTNADRAMRRAKDICLDIQQGKDDATLARNTELRFEGGDVPDLTPEQAQQIVDAARAYRC